MTDEDPAHLKQQNSYLKARVAQQGDVTDLQA